MGVQNWNEDFCVVEIQNMSGTRRLNGTLANSAVVNNGDGTVNIVITNHGLTAGCYIQILNTTNYNGVHKVLAVVDVNTIKIQATYVAETPAGTEVYRVALKPPVGFELMETRIKLDAASAAENLVYLLDAKAGTSFDATLKTTAMSGLTEEVIVWRDATKRRFFEVGDIIYFTYPNANNRTWGLTLVYRRLA
jgi:hypothetical protein